jgi:hypothetical protein
VRRPTLIASAGPATKVIDAVRQSGSLTVEAWIEPANATQGGPARIVTLSRDPGQRNFTLGQGAAAYEMRFRTATTSPNGEPSLWSPGGGNAPPAAMAMRTPTGDLAVIYLPAGGEVVVRPGALQAGLTARWFDPRAGEWAPAGSAADGSFVAPSADDWALLLR